MRYKIYLLLIGFMAMGQAEQHPWQKPTVEGFGIYDENLDYTEGFGAFMDLKLRPGTKNFDNGGGSHHYNTLFLKDIYGVENRVYDPFQRPPSENSQVLKEVETHSFDTATSNSVLNVINHLDDRLKHIFLNCRALKAFGIAYFKVWEGNRSSQEEYFEDRYQSNRPTYSYQKEVEGVFGKGNVVTDFARHLIIAYKNSGC